jgi:hypothetical protein
LPGVSTKLPGGAFSKEKCVNKIKINFGFGPLPTFRNDVIWSGRKIKRAGWKLLVLK